MKDMPIWDGSALDLIQQTGKPTLDQQPDWLELPEKQVYWTCLGHARDLLSPLGVSLDRPKGLEWIGRCSYLCPSAEEAEALAYVGCAGWQWDKNPAIPRTLADAMRRARRDGRAGVEIVGYREGRWVVIEQYPAGVPLPKSEREQ